ncbi:uncharacterized protein LOC114360306 [Ostrinia furnacalis]|uniref:uncharacterized protein LOC114360306 n=1 Tax=Ostrinia furnacalis TaxID=93504 RepID=UPI00103E6EB7|nr:uncharacterized protein LOC114360306 [Ostrinia furnacalis]
MFRLVLIVAVSAIAAGANGHVAYSKTANQLHPVHGLYVKPSVDGTTGDLYVAATEDTGAKTQWLTDQPVHFLPIQSQPGLPGYNLEEQKTQKRAVVNPPVQYAYALPVPATTETTPAAYPYAVPAANPTLPAQTESKTEVPVAAAIPQYNPYQFFYPQMMSAYANMMTILKDAGLNEETASSAVTHPSPMWPQAYAYPYQYVMVDPSAWAQAQAQTTATPVAPSTPASPVATETE